MHPDPVRNALESEAAAIRLTGRGLNTRSLPAQETERDRERDRDRETERERDRERESDTPALYTPLNESSTKQSDGLERHAGTQYVIL